MPRQRGWSPQAQQLFAALADAPDEWRYGYDISQENGLKAGTLYPLLMRLSEQRLLEAKWQESDQPGRPRRHVYRLTARGRAVALELAEGTKRPASARRRVKSAT